MESAKGANAVGDDEETAVGIECYANTASGFQAILKERYTDFIVNEIGLDGEVVHLTSLDAAVDEEIDSREQEKRQKTIVQLSATQEEPDDHSDRQLEDGKKAPAAAAATPSETQGEGTDAKVEQTEVAASVDFSAEIEIAVADFVKLAGPAEAERLKEFLEQPGVLLPAAEGKPAPAPLILASSNDKAYRTSMHVFFNSHFQLMTDTVEAPADEEASGPVKKDSKRPCLCIRVHPRKPVNSKGGNGGQKRNRDEGGGWKGHRRWPVNLPQYLEFTLCKENKDTGDAIGVLSRILHVKPRSFGFAGTKDRRGVTSQRVTIFKVRAARMAKLRLLGMKVGNYRYVDRDLRLGDLKGNLFTLTLRGIEEGSQLSISEAVRTLRTSGFINYFGLQRFGSHSIGTHVVGAALLRGAWEEAVDLILRPRDGDKPQVAMARSIFKEQGNAAAALKHMPTWCVAERSLLEGLVRAQKNDYVSAFSSIPRTTRKMYVHAYQSYLWNRAASERVRRHGLQRVVAGDLIIDTGCQTDIDNEDGDNDWIFSNVREVTPEEASAGVFSITDVVLPLPGSRVIYSESVQKIYEEICQSDGVQLVGFAHSVREYSFGYLTGAYRRLVTKPDKVKFDFVRYSDPSADLAETDLARLQPVQHDTVKPAGKAEEGELLALRLSFSLPTASYATMAIRELMKSSSSQASHKAATLSANHIVQN